jgi:hypothetical protein
MVNLAVNCQIWILYLSYGAFIFSTQLRKRKWLIFQSLMWSIKTTSINHLNPVSVCQHSFSPCELFITRI